MIHGLCDVEVKIIEASEVMHITRPVNESAPLS